MLLPLVRGPVSGDSPPDLLDRSPDRRRARSMPRPVVALDRDARQVRHHSIGDHHGSSDRRVPDQGDRRAGQHPPVRSLGATRLCREPGEPGSISCRQGPLRHPAGEQRAGLRQPVLPRADAQAAVERAVALDAPQAQQPPVVLQPSERRAVRGVAGCDVRPRPRTRRSGRRPPRGEARRAARSMARRPRHAGPASGPVGAAHGARPRPRSSRRTPGPAPGTRSGPTTGTIRADAASTTAGSRTATQSASTWGEGPTSDAVVANAPVTHSTAPIVGSGAVRTAPPARLLTHPSMRDRVPAGYIRNCTVSPPRTHSTWRPVRPVPPGERCVLDHLGPHRLEAAGVRQRRPCGHHARAERHAVGARRGHRSEGRRHHRYDVAHRRQLLVGLLGHVVRLHREQAVGHGPLVLRSQAPQAVGREPRVGVEEHQQVAARRSRARVARPRLAGPAVGRTAGRDHALHLRRERSPPSDRSTRRRRRRPRRHRHPARPARRGAGEGSTPRPAPARSPRSVASATPSRRRGPGGYATSATAH